MYLPGTCFEDNYKIILKSIIEDGSRRYVRGFNTIELSPFIYSTDQPLNNILTNTIRNTNKSFMSAEFLWMMSGRNDVRMISYYNSKISDYSDDGEIFYGAYGPHLQSQLDYIEKIIKDDKFTRQAVITIWQQNPSKTKDVPCTLSMQFIVNDKSELDMIVNMRSNDAWLGFPYDFYNFTMIQNYMALLTGCLIGKYTHITGSIHLYDCHLDVAKDAIKVPTYVRDIKNSLRMIKDELSEVMMVEHMIRNESSLESILKRSEAFSSPWKEMVDNLIITRKRKDKKECTN